VWLVGEMVHRMLMIAAWVLAAALVAPAQEREGKPLVVATLLADTEAVVPGKAFEVGVLLEMAPGWHTYWEYSGDAGLPTRVEWELPTGFVAGPLKWPAPEAKIESGGILTYAYTDKVLLLATITPPAQLAGEIELKAKVSWLVCEDICIPGDAAVSLSLPVGRQAIPANDAVFEEFRAQVPSTDPVPFHLNWMRSGKMLHLQLEGVPEGARIELFPLPSENQIVGHPQNVGTNGVEISVEGPFSGVLVMERGPTRSAWVVDEIIHAGGGEEKVRYGEVIGFWLALFYGFLGGMILNLMPCVLPVISLKIFGFIRQAGESRWRILSHGLAFAGGIFAWFLGLALIVVSLRSGGAEVTWAFQFQNPWFNVVIGSIVFVFALNLAGVFEIVLPGRAATAMESAGSGSGMGGAFFQGVFATLLATPCTAPFLGSALGFAFGQSGAVIFAMFASVAFGMALPYVLLSAKPGWLRFLPKPGAWMERLRQFMAFPLFATLIWILSVLGGQRGVAGILWFTVFLLCLAFACWLYGSFCGPVGTKGRRLAILALIVGVCLSGGWWALGKKFAGIGAQDIGGIGWAPFSKERLEKEIATGRAVFVDFTADWCITCKFNERTAIETPQVRELLKEKRVLAMKADWTNANPEITAALKSFGRVGVPFYVIYPPGEAAHPVVLPELLTESILVDALQNLP
jgi:DsbC/DsbD-like thiol-disulfide interchange protein/cytochrome c biogenesis protein CcdA